VPDELERLAALVQIKNDADAAIAALRGRPSASGNIGEFVAARVFTIQLMTSGSHPGHDAETVSADMAPSMSPGRTLEARPNWSFCAPDSDTLRVVTGRLCLPRSPRILAARAG